MSQEEVLWEGHPSKEIYNKIFKYFMISASLVGLMPLALLFVIDFWDFGGSSLMLFLQIALISTICGLSAFIFLMFYWMGKKMFANKWKNDKYMISKRKISCITSYSMMMSKTQTTKELSIENIYQYKIIKGFTDRINKSNTASIHFFDKNTTIPYIMFSHIQNPNEIREILDNLLFQRRLKELKKKDIEPYDSLDWESDLDKSTAIITTLIKIGISVLITLIPLYFIYLFSSIFDFDLLLAILFYLFLAALFIIGLSIYYITGAIKNIGVTYIINNEGIYEEDRNELLIKLDEIDLFLIKNPYFVRLIKRDAPNIIFFTDAFEKPALKIHKVKNHQTLRSRLMDIIYFKRDKKEYEQEIREKDYDLIEEKEPHLTYEDLSLVELEITAEELDYLKSYLTENEKIFKIIKPNIESYKKSFWIRSLTSLLPFLMVVFVIILLYYIIPIPSVFLFVGPIFLILLIFMIIMVVCSIGSQIAYFKKLKKSSYTITNQKIILKLGKKIDFIPIKSIETITLNQSSADKIFKTNTHNISINTKKTQKVMFMKVPRYFILNSVDNAQEVSDIIQKIRSLY